MATIVRLHSYPIKGCAGTEPSRSRLEPAGLTHDRRFMIVSADGVFRSQRRHPSMAVIRPDLGISGRLGLSAPGIESISVDIDTTSEPGPVELFGNPSRGIDQGRSVADWLSEYFGARSRLVRVPIDHDRVTTGRTAGTAGYADSTAVLMASTASLAELNRRLAARGAPEVPMNRFRANLIVDGSDEPHWEDRLRDVRVGGAAIGYAKPAIRCVVTTVQQETGRKDGPEPLRTLADYRRRDGGVAFGATFAVVRPGELAVGDRLHVDAMAPAG